MTKIDMLKAIFAFLFGVQASNDKVLSLMAEAIEEMAAGERKEFATFWKEAVMASRSGNVEYIAVYKAAMASMLPDFGETMREENTRRVMKKISKMNAKATSRSSYLHSTEFVLKSTRSGKRRLTFESGVKNPGLLLRMAARLGWDADGPVAYPMVNDTGSVMSDEERKRLEDMGYLIGGEKVLWRQSGSAWDFIQGLMPKAVDFRGYAHGLVNSAVTAYFPEVDAKIVDVYIDENGKLNLEGRGIAAGNDGAGWCSPEYAGQFRFLALPQEGLEVGAFAKGMLIASDDVPAGEIWLDSGSVNGGNFKGACKSVVKDMVGKTIVGDLGILRETKRLNKMDGCFETGECIPATPDNKQIVFDLTKAAVAKLISKGEKGLLRAAAKSDDNLTMAMELCDKAGVEYGDIPFLRDALDDLLQRKLWKVAQGGGIVGQQLVLVMDAGVKPGTIVANPKSLGAKVGDSVAWWRFPIVLEQGVAVAKIAKPSSRHLVNGEVPVGVVYCNVTDCEAAQGDDDGDVVAVSTDPQVIKLFATANGGWAEKADCWERNGALYAIEPGKTSVKFDALIEDMKSYIAGDPRGPVGTPTIVRAALLAVGDEDGARAMSVMVQYFVDQAKRKVVLPDYRWIAENPSNAWTLEDGWMKLSNSVPMLTCEGAVDGIVTDEEAMLEAMYEWQTERLALAGIPVDREGRAKTNALGWRRQGEYQEIDGEPKWMSYGKRIKLSNWNSVMANQKGVRVGNLVHTAYQAAWNEKSAILEAFGVKGEVNPKALFGLLDVALEANGIVVDAPKFTPADYMKSELRDRSGLKAWGAAWKRIATMTDSDKVREQKATIIADLQHSARNLTINEVVAIWRHEIHAGRINNAIRIASASGGAVATALSLEGAEHCDFMDGKLEATVNSIVESAKVQGVDPIKMMGERLAVIDETTASSHTAVHGIALVDCPCCMKAIETGMVRRLRAERSKTWAEGEMQLVRAFNSTEKFADRRL